MAISTTYLMGEVTAWTDNEAHNHGCLGGAELRLDALHDGYVVTLRPQEAVGVYIPGELIRSRDEQAIRKLISEACAHLADAIMSRLAK